jgi:predicted nucleic acid-binding protein
VAALETFLLSAQVLLDLCSPDDRPVTRWFAAQDTRRLRVSVISVAQARRTVQEVPAVDERSRLDLTLEQLLSDLKADGGPPLGFGAEHARVWQMLMTEPAAVRLPTADLQVCATAIHEQLTWVETGLDVDARLRGLGLRLLIL